MRSSSDFKSYDNVGAAEKRGGASGIVRDSNKRRVQLRFLTPGSCFQQLSERAIQNLAPHFIFILLVFGADLCSRRGTESYSCRLGASEELLLGVE